MGKRGLTGEHQKGRFGPQSNHWKGGRYLQRDGYIYIWVGRDHLMADYKGRVAEHRLVMAAALGRALTSNELVHHRNENKTDNRLENLELTSRISHMTHHRTWEPGEYSCAHCGRVVIPIRKPRGRFICCSRVCGIANARSQQKQGHYGPVTISPRSAVVPSSLKVALWSTVTASSL